MWTMCLGNIEFGGASLDYYHDLRLLGIGSFDDLICSAVSSRRSGKTPRRNLVEGLCTSVRPV
jgi:hypothetical protein